MGRAFFRVSDIVRVGRDGPQRFLRLLRPEGVENFQPEARLARRRDGVAQARFGFGVEKAQRALVDNLAGEVVFRRIDQLDDDIVVLFGDVDERGLGGHRF